MKLSALVSRHISRPTAARKSCIGAGMICSLFAAASAHADVVFTETFEDGNLGSRGWYDFDGPAPITTDEAYEGNSSLAYTYQPGAQTDDGLGLRRELPDMEVVYLRYARKYQDGWQWPTVDFGPHDFYLFADASPFQAPSSTYLTYYVEATSPGRATTAIKDELQGLQFGEVQYRGNDAVFTAGEWHLVDAMIQLNDPGQSNGAFRMWVDGVLQIEETGLKLRADDHSSILFNQLFFGPYYHEGSPQQQTFWTDNIIVADSPIAPVPLPAPLVLLGSALAVIAGVKKRCAGCAKGTPQPSP